MSDTSDFIGRLRAGDDIALMSETSNGIEVVRGTVQKAWSTMRITIDEFIVRDAYGKINSSIISIRYSKKASPR